MRSPTAEAAYRDITDFAHGAPSRVRHLAEIWTERGLLAFGVLFVASARQPR
ncbi:hypothetical protein [Streptomyces sp. NPDC051286]|uniref:hypothetical protein n=1 Tax=Streptomyces sp. NPDC051286 TaxID=3365647 RepID=UPI003796691A